jgi:hypothetical protein
MPEHIGFTEIQQFRNTIRTVKERAEFEGVSLPTLTFVGTVKLNGTNASVVFPTEGGHYVQNRSQVITPEQDNAGFAKWVEANYDLFKRLENSGVVVYGEWCGQGIQKGVAISQVPKQFIVFAVRKMDGSGWFDRVGIFSLIGDGLKCVYDYSSWTIDIDFNKPEEAQNRLVELTQAVEAECPVGKAFGVSGVGEGIVWWPQHTENFNTHGLAFKVKGEKHSESKVKTLAAVDVEKLASINELVDTVLTDHRLEKKLESLQEQGHPLDIKSTGSFLKLVGTDVWKEESDTILASGFKESEIMGAVQKKAKQWWMGKLKR